MKTTTHDEAAISRLAGHDGIGDVIIRDYFGRKNERMQPGPQGFLGEMLEHGAQIYPHFHDVDQFQVFVEGDGRFGRREIKPIAIQYADAYTPYGPIVAAPDNGISFFTLRLSPAGGGWRMPGNAHVMPGRPGRQVMTVVSDLTSVPQDGVTETPCLGAYEDGLAVHVLRLSPGTEISIDASASGGKYLLVCHGEVHHQSKVLPPNALLLAPRDEPASSVVAGAIGAVVICMSFPRPSARPGSDPANFIPSTDDYVR